MRIQHVTRFFCSTVVILIFMFSCSKDEPIIDDPEEDTTLVYKFDRIEVVETRLFVGSANGGVEVTEGVDPHTHFLTLFDKESKINYFKHDSLKVVADTLIEYPLQYEANTFRYKVGEEDSLFRWNIYAEFWQYYGKMPDDKQEIVYERHYSKLIKIRDQGYSFLLEDRGEGFVSESDFFWGNEYHFPSKAAMTELTDTLIFTNVKYHYKR